MIYGNADVDDLFGRGVPVRRAAGGVPLRRFRPHPGASASSSSSSSSGGDWGYRTVDGGASGGGGGGVDIDAIANQVVAELVNVGGGQPVSYGAEDEEPQFGAVVPTAALPSAAQNRLAEAQYVARMRRDVRDRSTYLREMEGVDPSETIYDPMPTEVDRTAVAAAEQARYGFACSVPARTRMGGLDVQTDVTRPSTIPPEFFGGTAGRNVPAPSYGAMPVASARYGEDAVRPASPFTEALKIGLGVGLGVAGAVVIVNALGRAMR